MSPKGSFVEGLVLHANSIQRWVKSSTAEWRTSRWRKLLAVGHYWRTWVPGDVPQNGICCPCPSTPLLISCHELDNFSWPHPSAMRFYLTSGPEQWSLLTMDWTISQNKSSLLQDVLFRYLSQWWKTTTMTLFLHLFPFWLLWLHLPLLLPLLTKNQLPWPPRCSLLCSSLTSGPRPH